MKKDWIAREPRDGWEQAEVEHLRLGLSMSFAERLTWLEEAARVAACLSREQVSYPIRAVTRRSTLPGHVR